MGCTESKIAPTVATMDPKARGVLNRPSPAEVPKVSRCHGGKQSHGVSGESGSFSQTVQIIRFVRHIVYDILYVLCILLVYFDL